MTRVRTILLALAVCGCPGSSTTQQPSAIDTEPVSPPGVVAEAPVSAAEPPKQAPGDTETMTAATDPITRLLDLPDAEYFAVTEDRLLELQAALSEVVEGPSEPPNPSALPPRLALGAPERVVVKDRPTVPVLLGSFQTGLRAWQVNFQPNLLVVVKDHASGELSFATPLVDMRRGKQPRPSGKGTPPDALNANTTRSGVKLIDLREKLGQRLRPGRISVTAIAYDIRSNTVELELEGEAPPVPAPAKTTPGVRHELDKRPSLPLEIEVPESGSARAGIKVRVAVQATRDAAIVRTEFNQPVLSGHLILVRLDDKPVIVPTFVPVQPVQDGGAAPVYNALYIADLGAEGHPIDLGKYQVYVDLGTELRGPFPLTVTD